MIAIEARLRDEVETLREEVRQLKAMLVPEVDIPERFGLTVMERRLFRHFASREIANYETLMAILAFEGGSERNDNTPRAHVFKMCRKLEPHGVFIRNVWGRGYRLEGWADKAVTA